MIKLFRALFVHPKRYKLSLELDCLDVHRLSDAVNAALRQTEQSQKFCRENGFTVAANLTYPATQNILGRLQKKLKEIEDQL